MSSTLRCGDCWQYERRHTGGPRSYGTCRHHQRPTHANAGRCDEQPGSVKVAMDGLHQSVWALVECLRVSERALTRDIVAGDDVVRATSDLRARIAAVEMAVGAVLVAQEREEARNV